MKILKLRNNRYLTCCSYRHRSSAVVM